MKASKKGGKEHDTWPLGTVRSSPLIRLSKKTSLKEEEATLYLTTNSKFSAALF